MGWLGAAGEEDLAAGKSAVTELCKRLNFHFDFKVNNLLLG